MCSLKKKNKTLSILGCDTSLWLPTYLKVIDIKYIFLMHIISIQNMYRKKGLYLYSCSFSSLNT